MMEHYAFTPDTLADRWSCSAQHVRDLINTGRLACFRIGRMYRIPYDTVIEFEKPKLEAELVPKYAPKPVFAPRVVKVDR